MNAKRTRNYYDMFAIMFNSQKFYRKYIHNTHLGLLTETHEYYFGSLKHQIFTYSRWQHPPKTISPRPFPPDHFPQTISPRPFPPDHIVDLEETAMGWVLRLIMICLYSYQRFTEMILNLLV